MVDSENTHTGLLHKLQGISKCKALNGECQVHSKFPINIAMNAEIGYVVCLVTLEKG